MNDRNILLIFEEPTKEEIEDLKQAYETKVNEFLKHFEKKPIKPRMRANQEEALKIADTVCNWRDVCGIEMKTLRIHFPKANKATIRAAYRIIKSRRPEWQFPTRIPALRRYECSICGKEVWARGKGYALRLCSDCLFEFMFKRKGGETRGAKRAKRSE